jgi:Na+/melibiose symporter-like transporter
VFGWLTSMISVFFCVKVQVADTPVADSTVSPVGRKKKFSLAAQWRSLRQAFRESPAFRRITINTFLHGFALWLATPLYVLYYVRNLGASDAWLGTQGMIASAVTILGYAFWRWLMGKWGESRTLKSTIVLVGVFPVLVGLLPSLTLILLAVALNSLIGAGVNLSHFNLLLKSMPADKRSEYTALYMTLMNLGIFIFPMLGVIIANWVGFRPALILFGLTSILGSTSFWWWQVQAKSVDR